MKNPIKILFKFMFKFTERDLNELRIALIKFGDSESAKEIMEIEERLFEIGERVLAEIGD